MSKSLTKIRQIELAIDELALRLATPASAPGDKLWLDWARSDQFGYRQEHWEKLAGAMGRKAAIQGWPLGESSAKTQFLEWARGRRGSAMSDFKEGSFIATALKEGWKLKGPSVEACEWAVEQEAKMMAYFASGAKSSAQERRGLSQIADVSGAEGSPELWGEMARRAPSAAGWLFKSASTAGSSRQSATDRSHRVERSIAVIEHLAPNQLDDALGSLFWGWSFDEESKKDSARIARALAAKGAHWLAPTQTRRGGEVVATTPLGKALRDKNEFAAQAAIESIGAAAFWSAAKADWTQQTEASYYPWDLARDLAVWAPKAGSVEPSCARWLLQVASCQWSRDEDGAQDIANAFKSLGSMARLEDASAWGFVGFGRPGENGVFKRLKGVLSPSKEVSAKEWARSAVIEVNNYNREGANCALGALIIGLMESGCPAPFESVKDAGLPESLEALFEGWIISAATPRRAGPETIKKGPVAL